MEFGSPKILLLIWLTPLVAVWWVWALRQREAALATFVSSHMQAKLAPKATTVRSRVQIALIVAGLFLSIIALSRPQWGEREETVYQRGRDVVIALDVSRSMMANDVHPNRLTRAKIDLIDLIQEMRGDRAALLAFRRDAQLICPLTTDYAFLRHALEGCGLHSAAAGETDIGSAIDKAMASFDNELGAHKIIVLISDGEDLEGKAISAAEKAAEKGIVIFTVGLGSDAGSRIPNTEKSGAYLQHEGSDVVTRLENETLDRIASITGGAYAPIATASTASHTLGDLYRQHLVNVSAQDLEETLLRRRVERYQWFLFPALLFFLGAGMLSRGRLATSAQAHTSPPVAPPNPAKALSIALLLILGTSVSPLSAQTNTLPSEPSLNVLPPGRSGARIAQAYFNKGDFENAAQAYLAASKGATRESASTFEFNAAVCYFENGDYAAAKDILATLAERADAEDAAQINRALGLAAYYTAQLPVEEGSQEEGSEEDPTRADLLKEAGEAFRRAARELGTEAETSDNLAVTLSELKTAEEEARISELMQKYEQSSPGQMAAEMLANQRRIKEGIAAASTNMGPSRIHDFETLAELQETTADLWVPLKQRILEAASQDTSDDAQKRLAQLNQQIESTRHNMLDASEQLQDLRLESETLAENSEVSVYQLWKMVAPHDLVLTEELRQQSNCVNWITAPDTAPISDTRFLGAAQGESRSLSDLFRDRFEQAMAQQQQAPPAPQNGGTETPQAPGGLDEETIQKIKELLSLATGAQDEALSSLERSALQPAGYAAREAYQYLKEIEKLLPKQQPSQGESEQQEQAQEQEQNQEPEPDENSQAQEQEAPEPSQEPNEEETGSDTNDTQEAEADPEDMLPEDVEKLLERALRREKEHEQERREKLNRIPLAPMKRDW